MDEQEMDRITQGCTSKAAKVRALNAAGVSTGDIGRYLGIRYQHVYNVLLRAGVIEKGEGASAVAPFDADTEIVVLQSDRNGAVLLPKELQARLGMTPGEPLYARVGTDGVTLVTREAALAHVAKVAREKMPGEAALIEALLKGAQPG